MTAKEKANELGNKFYRGNIFIHSKEAHLQGKKEAKQCALIEVKDIINILYKLSDCSSLVVDERDYYEEVKQEIEKL